MCVCLLCDTDCDVCVILALVILLHFALLIDDVKCILVMRVCLSVCLSVATCPHYCVDPDVNWGNGRGAP